VAANQIPKATAIAVAIRAADLRGIRFVIAESSYQRGDIPSVSQYTVPIGGYYGH
jgi:hypothetical protein